MANIVNITICFDSSELAEKAFPIVEEMIKMKYVPKELPWAAEAESVESLSKRCVLFGKEAARLDPLTEHPTCALKWLSRSENQILIERCADIQSPVDIFRPGDFYTQLCLLLSKEFPETCFSAICRHEESVSATVQLNRIISDHGSMAYEEMWSLDEEIDEDDWSRAGKMMLHECDGVILMPQKKDKA